MTMNNNSTPVIISEWARVCMSLLCVSVVTCYFAFVVCGRNVHLLLNHVVVVGRWAALDPFLLLSLQLVSHHLDGLSPLISGFRTHNKTKFSVCIASTASVTICDFWWTRWIMRKINASVVVLTETQHLEEAKASKACHITWCWTIVPIILPLSFVPIWSA